MTPLGALIEEVQGSFLDAHRVELTYGDIARRSGGRLNRQRVQQLAKDPIGQMPGPDKILGLALGLGVPEAVVLERALTSSGYNVPREWRREKVGNAAPTMKSKTEAQSYAQGLAEDIAASKAERNGQ